MRASEPTPAAWAVLVFAGLTTSTWWTHTDLGDSQLYQVVSRHMAEDGTWLAPRYLPDVHPRFFEHLPFGLWAGGVLALGRPARVLRALLPEGTRDEAGVRRTARVLLLASLFILTALCIPGRKVWNHSLVAFPLLAMLVGIGVGPWLEARLASPERARKATRGLAVLALVVLVASLAGAGRPLFPWRCPLAGALGPETADVPPGASVLVVSPGPEWTTVAAFAVERRWSPWRLTELGSGLAPGGPSEARVAFVAEGAPVSGPGWREVGREGRWRLLRKP